MRSKPLKEKYGKLPKITEKMPKSAVRIDSGAKTNEPCVVFPYNPDEWEYRGWTKLLTRSEYLKLVGKK